MRIAIFHELPKGGARRAINEYSRTLKKNHIVDLFLVDEENILAEKRFYNETFIYEFVPKEWEGKNWRVRIFKDTLELLQLARLHKKVAIEIDEKKYDFVLVSASKYIEAPFIMKYLKSPFLFYCQDPNYRIIYDDLLGVSKNLGIARRLYENLNRLIRKTLDRQNINFTPYALAPSKFIAQQFTKTYKKMCRVVYYGVDTDFFKPKKSKKDYDILYIGSKHPIDGYDSLLKIFSCMKKKPKVKILLSENEWVSDDIELREMYRRAKIVVCTARKEGLGAVPLEAMSCGIPVVAVDEAGHKETIINGKTGYLLIRDPKYFAEKVNWLLSNPQILKKLGENARRVMVGNWTWGKRAKELETEINMFLKKKN